MDTIGNRVMVKLVFFLMFAVAPISWLHAETTITFQTNAITVSQTAGSAAIAVECTGDIGIFPDLVYYETQNGTAVAGSDYRAMNSSMEFVDPGVQYISIPIIYTGSTVDRTFSIVLTSAENGGNLGSITSITVTIKAEPVRPPVVFNFSKAAYTVTQGAGAIQIPVTFTNFTRFSNVWITYATKDDTATSGIDYTGTSSTKVTFAVGANTAVITVPISKTGATSNRTFNVFLTASSEGSLGTRSFATVTILKPIPVPKIDFLTTAGPVGIPFNIYGKISNLKDSDIASVQLIINGKRTKILGKKNWRSRVVFKSTGRFKMAMTVNLKNGKKIKKSGFLSIT